MEILLAFGQMGLAAMVLACCYGVFGIVDRRPQGRENGGSR